MEQVGNTMNAFEVGLMLGLSLIVAIGAQNVFLIRQGVLNQHPFFSAFICLLCDAFLMLLGVMGLGLLVMKLPVTQYVMLIGAGVFLLSYGGSCFYRAFKPQAKGLRSNNKMTASKKRKVFWLALTFSLLNPHAIIDALVLMGGSANQFHGVDRYYFLLGGICSSLIWFTGLVSIAKRYSYLLLKPRVWQCLEFLSGTLMWAVFLLILQKFL